jgi:hypothetical protein
MTLTSIASSLCELERGKSYVRQKVWQVLGGDENDAGAQIYGRVDGCCSDVDN